MLILASLVGGRHQDLRLVHPPSSRMSGAHAPAGSSGTDRVCEQAGPCTEGSGGDANSSLLHEESPIAGKEEKKSFL